MTSDQDQREEMVFEAAVQLPPEHRAAYLERTCANEPKLRDRVEGLLGAFERGAGLLKEPAVAASAKIAAGPTEKPGDQIDRYKLLQRIGEGGCGVVYMAEQLEPVKRRVALKVIKLGMDTREVVARFEAERQALAVMDHPNIAKVHDAGATETGRPYFVMELVRGVKITDYCDENNLSTRERLALFIQICQAVQHAHQKGIIHRDLKPSNILVTVNDGVPVPKVIDFGIAKVTSGQQLTDKTFFTAFEQFIGTPAYMSPEQAVMTSLDVDTRTDVYSLGVLLYEMLTGSTPFGAEDLLKAGLDEMRRRIQEDDPPRPSTRLGTMLDSDLTAVAKRQAAEPLKLVHLLRGDLDWIVMKALEKDRGRRYDTASALASDVKRYLSNEPVVARPPSSVYRFRKLVRRNKLAFAATVIVAATFLLGGVVSTWQAIRAREAEQGARLQASVATSESARARDAERRARLESELANASLYAANMRLAQNAWNQNAAGQVRQLLKETADHQDRGFEWFYWQHQTHLQLATLRSHRAEILAVAASPDGRWIATASQDGTAVLWALPSGNPARTLRDHRAAVASVAFSPDSQRIVTGSWDHTARVWETGSGRLQLVLTNHDGEVFSAGFSPDGQRIVTGSLDRTARTWNAFTGEERLTLRGHEHWVWSAAFSSDGRLIVTGSQDHTAKVWDAVTGEERRTFSAHIGPIQSVAASPGDARVVATASRDLTARIWDMTSGRELVQPLKGHGAPIFSVTFSRTGDRLVTGSFDQTAKVWDAASGAELFTLRGHGSPISSAAFSADGGQIITGGGSVGIPPTAAYVDRGLGDGNAKIWTASPDQGTVTLRGHTSKVMGVGFSPDGRRIITASFDKTAIVWDAFSGSPLFHLHHDERVRTVAFSPDGQRIATGSFDGLARIWSASGDKVLTVLAGASTRIYSLAFSSDGQRIVTGADDGARVWSTIDGRLLADLDANKGWVFSTAFSPDGALIATSRAQTAAIWETASSKKLRTFTGHSVFGVAFSPEGRRVATGGDDQTARIWDVSTGTNLLTLRGHSAPIWAIAFSPDGRRVVTASEDRTAKVWNALTGRELLTLAGHTDELWSAAFSPDGHRIVTGSSDGTAKVWQAATEEQVRHWLEEDRASAAGQDLENRSLAVDGITISSPSP